MPPSVPIIKNEQGATVPSIAGPYLEGETLQLTCESNTGAFFFILFLWQSINAFTMF